MNPRRIAAVARRIAEGFRRDRRSLALLIVAPLLITALLGWVLRDQSAGSTRLVVANPGGPAGALVATALGNAAPDVDPDFGLTVTADAPTSADEAKTLIRDGKADVALVLPSDIPAAIASGTLSLTLVTAGTDPVSDGPRLAAVGELLRAAAKSLAPPGAVALTPTLTRETVYLSPDADQLDVLAPVFLGLFAYFFVFILTGISFLRERVGGTLERLLATPVTRGEIVVGYSLGFGFFATIQVLVLTLFVLGSLDVPAIGPIGAFTIGLNVQTAGSPAIAFLVAVLLAIGAVNLGIFLSTFARTELQVLQFIPIVILPQAVLGGVFWPVDRLPDVLQTIARILPVTYAVDALREVMLKGADLASSTVQTDLLVLAGIALFFVVLGARTIKREVA
jgi:ABC-2 type transport system permease protein